MTEPNIRNPASIIGKLSTSTNVGTSLGQVLAAPGTNNVYKVNSIFAANTSATGSAKVSITVYRNSTDYYLAKEIVVPIEATQIISTKETYFYLQENDALRAQKSGAGTIDVIISYELITN